MTHDTRPSTPPTAIVPAPHRAAKRRLRTDVAVALTGCIALGSAGWAGLQHRQEGAPQPPLAAVAAPRVAEAARHSSPRIAAAPAAPFAPASAHHAGRAGASGGNGHRPASVGTDANPPARPVMTPRSAAGHRFDPVEAGTTLAFDPRPAIGKPASTVLVASLAPVQPARPSSERAAIDLAASSQPAGKPAESRRTASAAIEPEHVETALPDLPADPVRPALSAREALERELADAVPRPTARPFRTVRLETARRRAEPAAPGLLAYARPDAGSLGDEPEAPSRALPSMPSLGAGTAVYDISAATVYLPNGERLEAHSGLGKMRDDVRFAHQKNRGPTPPHTYNLTMRESLFHGVAAIRLHPVGGERRIHNRVGLLAHTYMLGPRGDSNGCVSFKDYKRFLAAFQRGEIRRLVVVPSFDKPKTRLASLFGFGRAK